MIINCNKLFVYETSINNFFINQSDAHRGKYRLKKYWVNDITKIIRFVSYIAIESKNYYQIEYILRNNLMVW